MILIGMAGFFGLHLRGNPLLLLLAIVAGALAFLAIGFAISGSHRIETAASYANLVTFPCSSCRASSSAWRMPCLAASDHEGAASTWSTRCAR